ncbi:MAG: cobalamin-dependent protein [Acidobacteria bacterium]|nr:cobalamin-dependent protein [Acidobacteriota bacterium]
MRVTSDGHPLHPKGSRARVLLCSVFGPYAQDDEYGSRSVNPMELYQNQVTRMQGPFSLRMFHRSWGMMLIQANIEAPCTLLDFPDLERFRAELREHEYDVVGIGAIVPNVGKVAKMCAVIRELQPRATIVVGGHVANHQRIHELVDADHVVRGEGVQWFRRFLGEDPTLPVRHPLIQSGFGTRILGVYGSDEVADTAATVIPSVGCPLGCDFCATSAMFGGKGKSFDFYSSGDELYDLMARLEEEMGVSSFFVMDENFLLHRKRAMRLLELMKENGKAWSFMVFSSANALRLYTMEDLVALGISWVWMGLEGDGAAYRKLHNADTRALVREMQSNGIRVLGSSIVGLREHTPENIDTAIDYAVSHDTDFHQFMLYTPVPGTPLWRKHEEEGTLLDESECPTADVHGQTRFNYRHPHIKDGQEGEMLVRAFRRDFDVNGPSIVRMLGTLLKGYLRHRDNPDPRVRARFWWETRDLRRTYAGIIWASERWFRSDPAVRAKVRAVRDDLRTAFGWRSAVWGAVVGPVILTALWLEQRRLDRGWTYEPATFYESNKPLADAGRSRGRVPALARWVEPSVVSEDEARTA